MGIGVCRRCEVAGVDGEIVRVHWFSRDAALLAGGGIVFLVCGGGSRFFDVVVGTCWLQFWFLVVGLMPKRSEDPFYERFLAKFVREEAECKKND